MVIEKLGIANFFASYGDIVTGDDFVGRSAELRTVRNRTLGDNYGNIAIMGLPRIGKTSLAWNALLTQKEEFVQKGYFISYIGTGTADSADTFFKMLVFKTLEEIAFSPYDADAPLHQRLSEFAQALKVEKLSTFERNELIQKFFRFLKRQRKRAIFILDEFDSAKKLFNVSDFQLLRELASKPETKICLVTVSRRTIQEIEPENGAISNFYGIFSDLRLGLFSEADSIAYWKWVEKNGVSVSDEYKERVETLVGKHPYLIGEFNYRLLELMIQNTNVTWQKIIEKAEEELSLSLHHSLNNALDLLKEEGLYSKVFQLVLGPVYDVSAQDEEKLIKYGFIKGIDAKEKRTLLGDDLGVAYENKQVSYICFSKHLTSYLKVKSFDVDFWPLWGETENELRQIVKDYLHEAFGNDWETEYKKQQNSENRNKRIENLQVERDKAQKNFPHSASSHIVDYTYPKDLYDVFMAGAWKLYFGEIFGESKNERKQWAEKFNHLAKVRNPIAHSNAQFVPKHEISLATRYCQEILDKINDWRASKQEN